MGAIAQQDIESDVLVCEYIGGHALWLFPFPHSGAAIEHRWLDVHAVAPTVPERPSVL